MLAEFICSQYLNSDFSPFEINVDKKNIQQVLSLIEKSESFPLERNLFEPIEKIVDTNLADTFARFRFTSEYISYIQSENGKSFVLGRIQ
jgi:hypothetical protein